MTHPMQLPAWLEATNMLATAIEPLPASFPRPGSLVSPQTEAELEAWTTQEAERRERLDSAVREWLSRDHWPVTLDATDGFLLVLRIAAARDWLELGHHGIVVESKPTEILEALLIDGWSDSFLEQHCREVRYRMAEYSCGFNDSGGFAV